MRLVQLVEGGERRVAIVEDTRLALLDGIASVHGMAMKAIETGKTLEALALESRERKSADYETVARPSIIPIRRISRSAEPASRILAAPRRATR